MEPASQGAQVNVVNLETEERPSLKDLHTVEIPQLPDSTLPPRPYNDVNEKQLRSALIGACKRMPRNAEAHFHLGLMYLRKSDGDEALQAFHHCRRIYAERFKQYEVNNSSPPPHLVAQLARLRIHVAQAAHLAAQTSLPHDDRVALLERLQRDLLSAANLDPTQPDAWNALGLLHLLEGGTAAAKQLLLALHSGFPDYLDALNNLGLAETSSGNFPAAISTMQKVLLYDNAHAESLTNYGILLLQTGMFPAANKVFIRASQMPTCRTLASTWGALAISQATLGNLDESLSAAAEAEQLSLPVQRPRFALIHSSVSARVAASKLPSPEARAALDAAILRLRALARELRTASAHAALALALRVRHDHVNDETGNRNFGAEAAERLVECLELDESDGAAWTQLALLQMWTGDYQACKEFATQAVSRSNCLESGWNCLAVASQMSDELNAADRFYEKAVQVVLQEYQKGKGQEEANSEGESEEMAVGAVEEADTVMLSSKEDSTSGSETVQLSVHEEQLTPIGRNILAALYNNIGIMKRQEGRRSFAEASTMFEKSLKLGGENALVYNNLGLLYVAADRLGEAKNMFTHALKLKPDLECAKSNEMKLVALLQRRERDEASDEDFDDHFSEL